MSIRKMISLELKDIPMNSSVSGVRLPLWPELQSTKCLLSDQWGIIAMCATYVISFNDFLSSKLTWAPLGTLLELISYWAFNVNYICLWQEYFNTELLSRFCLMSTNKPNHLLLYYSDRSKLKYYNQLSQ